MVRDILTEGEVYELQGIDRYGMYLVKGLWLTGERFEPASREEWLNGRPRP